MADFKGMRIAKMAGSVKPRVGQRLQRRREPAQLKQTSGKSSGPSSRELMIRMMRDFSGSVDKLRASIDKMSEQRPQSGRDIIRHEVERIERVAAQVFPREREVRQQITSDFRERAAKSIKTGTPQAFARLLQLTADIPPLQKRKRQLNQAVLTNDLRRSPSKVGARLAEMIRSGEAAKLIKYNTGGIHKLIAALEKGPSPKKSSRTELYRLIEQHKLVPLAVQVGHLRELAERGTYRPHTPPPSQALRLQQVLEIDRERGPGRPSGPDASSLATGTEQPEYEPVAMGDGGMVNGPTLTMLGERGFSEAVVPFDPAAMAAHRPEVGEPPGTTASRRAEIGEMPGTMAGQRISGRTVPPAAAKSIKAATPEMSTSTLLQPLGPSLGAGSAGSSGDTPGTPLAGPALRSGRGLDLPPVSKPTAARPVTLTGRLELGANGINIGEATLEGVRIEGLEIG